MNFFPSYMYTIVTVVLKLNLTAAVGMLYYVKYRKLYILYVKFSLRVKVKWGGAYPSRDCYTFLTPKR